LRKWALSSSLENRRDPALPRRASTLPSGLRTSIHNGFSDAPSVVSASCSSSEEPLVGERRSFLLEGHDVLAQGLAHLLDGEEPGHEEVVHDGVHEQEKGEDGGGDHRGHHPATGPGEARPADRGRTPGEPHVPSFVLECGDSIHAVGPPAGRRS
jgi:hypothetical protein